ncbi:MAG: DNA-processing protein DprA [Lachnospiraceae bacterium]|nr:DNA-processing protein DprA [Lachnospiraceae bacterium]
MDIYKNFLGAATDINNSEKRQLIMALGSPEEVYKARAEHIEKANVLDKVKLKRFLDFRKGCDISGEAERLEKMEIGAVFFDEDEFPDELVMIDDAPYVLYYLGHFPQAGEKRVAMVGARYSTGYGRTVTIDIAKAASSAGYVTVSGMARGIDRACHVGTLEAGGVTYAILGCGVDICYPPENSDIYVEIKKKGGVISEFYPGAAPIPQMFPRRNRIISGLSMAVLVMEAREKSGSLITANIALDQGKSVYALPGRVSDRLSSGCNLIISQGAGIITGREQIMAELDNLSGYKHIPLPADIQKAPLLDQNEKVIYNIFEYDPVSLDEIQRQTHLSIMEVISSVVSLCKLGLIRETFLNQYIRIG